MCTCPHCTDTRDQEKAAGVTAYAAWLDRPAVDVAVDTCDHLSALRRRHRAATARPSYPPIPEEPTRAHA